MLAVQRGRSGCLYSSLWFSRRSAGAWSKSEQLNEDTSIGWYQVRMDTKGSAIAVWAGGPSFTEQALIARRYSLGGWGSYRQLSKFLDHDHEIVDLARLKLPASPDEPGPPELEAVVEKLRAAERSASTRLAPAGSSDSRLPITARIVREPVFCAAGPSTGNACPRPSDFDAIYKRLHEVDAIVYAGTSSCGLVDARLKLGNRAPAHAPRQARHRLRGRRRAARPRERHLPPRHPHEDRHPSRTTFVCCLGDSGGVRGLSLDLPVEVRPAVAQGAGPADHLPAQARRRIQARRLRI